MSSFRARQVRDRARCVGSLREGAASGRHRRRARAGDRIRRQRARAMCAHPFQRGAPLLLIAFTLTLPVTPLVVTNRRECNRCDSRLLRCRGGQGGPWQPPSSIPPQPPPPGAQPPQPVRPPQPGPPQQGPPQPGPPQPPQFAPPMQQAPGAQPGAPGAPVDFEALERASGVRLCWHAWPASPSEADGATPPPRMHPGHAISVISPRDLPVIVRTPPRALHTNLSPPQAAARRSVFSTPRSVAFPTCPPCPARPSDARTATHPSTRSPLWTCDHDRGGITEIRAEIVHFCGPAITIVEV